MIGCCGFDSYKFKYKDGQIDEKRLACLCEHIDSSKPNKEKAEKVKAMVKSCDCPCHVDNTIVLC